MKQALGLKRNKKQSKRKKNYKKEAGLFRKIKMPSNNFDVSTEFPPYPPLPKEEQAKFHRLPKEKKVLNIDLRNKGAVERTPKQRKTKRKAVEMTGTHTKRKK